MDPTSKWILRPAGVSVVGTLVVLCGLAAAGAAPAAPGKTIIGPSLAGVYGRKAGAVAGFQYSDAMKGSGLAWNAGNLDSFLANPTGKVPGTLMGFAGIKDAAQRKAVIDYLKTL